MAAISQQSILDNPFLSPQQKEFPKSPLRYPGGKARAVNIVLKLLPRNISELASPFLGGGSIEIAAATLGINVFGYDVFKPLVDFWEELLENPKTLAQEVEKHFPLSKEEFYSLQKRKPKNKLESATIFYVLNRCSFSGATLSGGMSPGHPRFTENSINYLKSFRCPNLHVKRMDFQKSILKHKNTFLYLDPPYLIESALYGKNGNTHKNFPHEILCEILHQRNGWILSYNDSPIIRKMYMGYQFYSPNWKYGMSEDKNSRELLIFSNDIPDIPESIHA